MTNFYLTVIHRPEMVPEYLQKEAQEGKAEDIGRSGVIRESLDIFRTQQRVAHDNGIRTTIQMTYASLFNAEAVAESSTFLQCGQRTRTRRCARTASSEDATK